jgi:hypothetical protein
MRRQRCSHRDAVHRAIEAGSLSPSLREHLDKCRACRETFQVASWLRQAAEEGAPSPELRHSSHLWWRAQIIRRMTERQELAERATWPSLWAQVAGLLILAASISAVLAWLAPEALQQLSRPALDSPFPELLSESPGLVLAALLSVGPVAGVVALCLLLRDA